MPRLVNLHCENGYVLGVYGGSFTENNLLKMSHGEIYSIMLENNNPDRVKVNLRIDGDSVGTFIIGPYQQIEVEHPLDLARKFTFFQTNLLPQSHNNRGISAGLPLNGMIVATFTPEKVTPPKTYYSSFRNGQAVTKKFSQNGKRNSSKWAEGSTAFTLPSSQTFERLEIIKFDKLSSTKIKMKLVGQRKRQTHYQDQYQYQDQYHSSYQHPEPCQEYYWPEPDKIEWFDNPWYVKKPSTRPSTYSDARSHDQCTTCCACQCGKHSRW